MSNATAITQNAAVVRSFISLVVTLIIMGVLLFAPAGTLDWPLGWWFMAAFVVCTLIAVAVIWRLNPEIFVARSRIQPGTKAWDYFFITAAIGGFALVLPVAALDFRFGWSTVPAWAIWLGYLLFLLAYGGSIWPVAVNRHFEPGVRIQKDRGQTVVDTGPYAIVRHPGYICGSLLAWGMALMLASWWALIPALAATLALAVRTIFEERTLRAELPGYTEYTQRVKYRWVPGVW
jgi:protein-S-isoprenylcysteine O-methyltransferase Ste14